MITPARLPIAEAGVCQLPTDGFPLPGIALLHHARQFIGITPGVIMHLEAVRS